MRKLALLVVVAFAFLLVAAAPAQAGRRWTAPAPTVQPNFSGPCVDGINSHWHSLMTDSSPNISRSGVSATINLSNAGFDICDPTSVGKGTNAYISIEPRIPTSDLQIIQLGIIECGGVPGSVCMGENNPRWFYAYGGCLNFPFDHPTPHDLGPADMGSHTIALYLDTDNNWHLHVDGNRITFLIPNTYIACWSGGLRKATWSYERLDRGDSSGNQYDTSLLSNAKWGRYGYGWFDTNFADGDCTYNEANNVCHAFGGDAVSAWTFQ